ncbi:MAG: hypothetical protein ACQ9CV_03785 [Nitrosopumilus sp.]
MQEFCKEILKIDPKIRFVGILHEGKIFYKIRKGTSSLLEKSEVDQSVRSAVLRWDTRIAQNKKLGIPDFSLTKYNQIYRITLSLSNDDLIFFSTDLDCDIFDIIHVVQNVKEELKSKNN